MGKIRSYRGKLLDTDMLFGADTTPSIGNMNVNAGGDIIDANGKVVKTRDEVAREYYKDVKKSVVTSSILDDIDDDDGDFELPHDPKVAKKQEATQKRQQSKPEPKVDPKPKEEGDTKPEKSEGDKGSENGS